jgi:uncharacterized protein
MAPKILVPHEQLAALCEKHHITKLSFFGSILHDEFRAESDIDVLVEFEPGCVPGLEFFTIQDELSALFGRPVDLHTANFLSQYFRETVQSEAELQYAAR